MEEQKHLYMMLSRLQSDCKYYLGNGNRRPKVLWALEEKAHIEKMKELWNQIEEKPEWISLEEIEDYESKMVNQNNEIELTELNELHDFYRKIKNEFKKGETLKAEAGPMSIPIFRKLHSITFNYIEKGEIKIHLDENGKSYISFVSLYGDLLRIYINDNIKSTKLKIINN